MNNREQNKKFQQQSNIKNSEFNRLNVNSNQDTSSISRGNVILPPDLDDQKKKYTQTTDILLKILCGAISILLFIFIPPLFESIIPYDFYDSLSFLFLSLAICASLSLILFYSIKFFLIKQKRS